MVKFWLPVDVEPAKFLAGYDADIVCTLYSDLQPTPKACIVYLRWHVWAGFLNFSMGRSVTVQFKSRKTGTDQSRRECCKTGESRVASRVNYPLFLLPFLVYASTVNTPF